MLIFINRLRTLSLDFGCASKPYIRSYIVKWLPMKQFSNILNVASCVTPHPSTQKCAGGHCSWNSSWQTGGKQLASRTCQGIRHQVSLMEIRYKVWKRLNECFFPFIPFVFEYGKNLYFRSWHDGQRRDVWFWHLLGIEPLKLLI